MKTAAEVILEKLKEDTEQYQAFLESIGIEQQQPQTAQAEAAS